MGHGPYGGRGTHGSWIVQWNGHPWIMDCTAVGAPMGHGSYDGMGTHGSWIVQWNGHPWVIGQEFPWVMSCTIQFLPHGSCDLLKTGNSDG